MSSSISTILLLIAAAAGAPAQERAPLPDNLRVPEGQSLLLRAAARGVQIYRCRAKAEQPASLEWVLEAPEAELLDQSRARIGRHYAGPTWESTDGSRVVGEVVERSPVADAIPWLLLRARSNEGAGALAKVRYIQRVDTAGGMAPSRGCDAPHLGAVARIEYSANYDFYGTR